MTEQELVTHVSATLSAARLEHVEGVVQTATFLAERYGADVKWARIGAWTHDIAREWPEAALEQAVEEIQIPSGFASIPNLLHGPIAASLFREWFGSDQPDVENAIRYHTTGRLGMSTMEMILCLADAIEPTRAYPGVAAIRQHAQDDLVYALAESMDTTISYLLTRHEAIFPLTVMARNELWTRLRRDARATGA